MAVGTLASRLTMDTSGAAAAMTDLRTISDKELTRIQRQVKIANDYLRDLTRSNEKAATSAAGMAQSARHLEGMTISTGQYAAAMRTLPAQLTDVATQLAGGANPLLILMQQGGQVKDSFGGFANTFKALGGMLSFARVGMLGVAGAVAGVAYEMVQGAARSDDFAKSVALTGNAAALTEQRLRDMASAQAAVAGRGVLDQRDTLTALASTGRFGPQALEAAGQAMGRYQKLSGETADKAIGNFAAITDGAAKWAAEQNKHVHFLTAEQYKHIKALEDTGHAQEAVVAALQAYNKELESRHIPQMGYVSRVWEGFVGWIQKAKDALMNWGVAADLGTQLASVQARLAGMDKMREAIEKRGGKAMDASKGYLDLKAEEEQIKARMALEKAGADARAELAAREEARIKKLTDTKAPKKAPHDYLGDVEDGWKKKWADWWQRDQEARDKYDMLPDHLGEADDAMKKRWEDWAQRDADARQAAEDKASFGKGVDKAAQTWWDGFNDRATQGATQFKNAMQGMEDAVVNWAKTGKLSAADFFASMAEDYLRQMVKMAQAKLFFDAAGNFTGLAGIGSFIGSMFGIPLATGTNNVPYDGMPAILHKGEAVVPAAYNPATGGKGAGTTVDASVGTLNVGQGVSRAEVFAALQQHGAMLDAQWRRRMRQGAY